MSYGDIQSQQKSSIFTERSQGQVTMLHLSCISFQHLFAIFNIKWVNFKSHLPRLIFSKWQGQPLETTWSIASMFKLREEGVNLRDVLCNQPVESLSGGIINQLVIISYMSEANKQPHIETNYLTSLTKPPIDIQHMYDYSKTTKSDYTYVQGLESHLLRRKMILRDHPEISKLLVPDKPWTIMVALSVISLALLVCYWAKDQNIYVWLLSAYFISGTLNHTLHCCVHDFIHLGGHANINVNKVMAVLCNIPTGLPAALSFGRYHSEHHNFMGEENVDPDMPLLWQAKQSYQHKWYKFAYYLLINFVYSVRPLLMKKFTPSSDEWLNVYFIVSTNLLILLLWGPWALLYIITSGFMSVGPHPAAAHLIAEHYEFVPGMQTYSYYGWWNFLNINVGYHTEHHDFPNCPWYNLPKLREIAKEYYDYLPAHHSYFKVIQRFLSDMNYNLFNRTIRIVPKNN